MFDYAEIAHVGLEVIKEFGLPVTLSRPSADVPTYDVATGIATPASPATYEGYGVLLAYKQSDYRGGIVMQGDERLLLAAVAPMVKPNTSDDVIINGKTYAVKGLTLTSPAGTDVLYDVQIRGV